MRRSNESINRTAQLRVLSNSVPQNVSSFQSGAAGHAGFSEKSQQTCVSRKILY
jgi:hypothetical protein